MKFSGVKYLVEQGVDNVWKNRMMAFASFCVLLVSLLLVGLSVLLYYNVNSIIGGIEEKNEVIVYFDDTTTDEQLTEIGETLGLMDNISEVNFYSKEEAFLSLRDSMAEYEVLFESLGDDNPLVDAYRLRVADIGKISDTIAEIEKMDHIYSIRAPYDFVNILIQLRTILTWVMGAIIIAMIIVSMVIISNTTKASVYARREEIQIMKYVGASNAFIRLPFFIEGMITGFLAGCSALIITWLVYDSIVGILQEQVALLSIIGMGSIIQFSSIYVIVTLAYICGGALVGAIGSVVSTTKHIDV